MAHQLQPAQAQHPSSPASALAGDGGSNAIALALQSTPANASTASSSPTSKGANSETKTTSANESRGSICNLKRTKVRSLVSLCTSKLIEHCRYIDDVGPYTGFHVLEPVLAKVSPKHLRHLEIRSPHLELDSGKLWYAFIQRDFPKFALSKKGTNDGDGGCGDEKSAEINGESKKDPSFYRRVFEKLSFEQEKRRSKALDNLKKNYRMLESQKHSKSAVALDKETSIKMINMVANKKRKKTFFKDDISASSPIMKKVKRDLSSRSNMFRTRNGSSNGARPQLAKSPLFLSASSVVARPKAAGGSTSNNNASGSVSGCRPACLSKSESTTSVPVLRGSSRSGFGSVTSTGTSNGVRTASRSTSSRSIDVVSGVSGPRGNSDTDSSSNSRPHAPSPLTKTHSRQSPSARPKPSIFMPRSKPKSHRPASTSPEAIAGSGSGSGSNSLVNSRPSLLSSSTKPRQSGATSKLFQPTPFRNAASQRANMNTNVIGSTSSLSQSPLASHRPISAHSRSPPMPPSRPASTSRPASANTGNNAGHYSTSSSISGTVSTSGSTRSVSAGRRNTRTVESNVRSGNSGNDGGSTASNNEQRNRGGKLLTSSLFLNTKKY